MKFVEIYNRIIPYWEDKIDFSDGIINESDQKYFKSNSFSTQWDKIEEIVGHDDTYGDLMVWTMYQVFHRHALKLFHENIFTLNSKEISKTEIEEQYYSNLQSEGWEVELNKYERTIKLNDQ